MPTSRPTDRCTGDDAAGLRPRRRRSRSGGAGRGARGRGGESARAHRRARALGRARGRRRNALEPVEHAHDIHRRGCAGLRRGHDGGERGAGRPRVFQPARRTSACRRAMGRAPRRAIPFARLLPQQGAAADPAGGRWCGDRLGIGEGGTPGGGRISLRLPRGETGSRENRSHRRHRSTALRRDCAFNCGECSGARKRRVPREPFDVARAPRRGCRVPSTDLGRFRFQRRRGHPHGARSRRARRGRLARHAAGEITGHFHGAAPNSVAVLRALVFGRIAGAQSIQATTRQAR